jgi:SAM-dependent methyltransferase
MLKRGFDLHQAVVNKLVTFPKGRVLDAGVGKGELAMKLVALGYDVDACDCMQELGWRLGDRIAYRQCDMNTGLPYEDASFDYVACLEVIEHVENPFALCRELKRILRGGLFISTPNILNIKSRVRFMLEGNYEFFKYPPIEWDHDGAGANAHVNPIRLHELEYYLYKCGLRVEDIFSNQRSYGWRLLFLVELMVRLQTWRKVRRSQRPGEIPLGRLYSKILTDDLLYGGNLIVLAKRL